jgi:hypothetical protein
VTRDRYLARDRIHGLHLLFIGLFISPSRRRLS